MIDRSLTAEQSRLAADHYAFAMRWADRAVARAMSKGHSRHADAIPDRAVDRLMLAASLYDPDSDRAFLPYLAAHLEFGRRDAAKFGVLEPVPRSLGFDPVAPLDGEPDDDLREATKGLRAFERALLELVFLQGCTHKEAARLLGMSQSATTLRIRKALDYLARGYGRPRSFVQKRRRRSLPKPEPIK